MEAFIRLNRIGCAALLHKGNLRCQDLCSSSWGKDVPPISQLNVQQAVALWEQRFQQCGVSEPCLSSQYIMAHILGAKTMANLDPVVMTKQLTEVQTHQFWELCSKRLARMPVQYVIEEWDFRDLTLKMRPPVFIPRPETEELVSLVLAGLQSKQRSTVTGLRCLELCCGSGAISLSLLHSLPQLSVVAVDKSQEALSLTRENALRLGLQDRLETRQLDLTADAGLISQNCGPVDALVSNPPYLFSQDMTSLDPEILRFEDPSALDGGADGMQIIRQILSLTPHLLKDKGSPAVILLRGFSSCRQGQFMEICNPGFLYLEVDPRHPSVIQKFVEEEKIGLQFLQAHCDITNRPRFCVLQRREEEHLE